MCVLRSPRTDRAILLVLEQHDEAAHTLPGQHRLLQQRFADVHSERVHQARLHHHLHCQLAHDHVGGGFIVHQHWLQTLQRQQEVVITVRYPCWSHVPWVSLRLQRKICCSPSTGELLHCSRKNLGRHISEADTSLRFFWEQSSRPVEYLLNIRQKFGDEAVRNFIHGFYSWDDGWSVEGENDPELGVTSCRFWVCLERQRSSDVGSMASLSEDVHLHFHL